MYTILAIDDELSIRESYRLILATDYHLLLAEEGRAGLDILKEHHVDLILLDLTMPKLSEDAALSRMGQIKPEVPVVLCSGYDEQDASRNVAGGNFAGFLQKPYRYEKLISTLSDALGR